MTESPNHSSTARLIVDNNSTKCAPVQQPQGSKVQDFLRHSRLQLLGFLLGRAFRWWSPIEQRKVASYRSRRMAALNSIFHLVPFCGAVTLLSLYWIRCWVGGTSDNATTLQFVAKLHEMTMQASLVDVLLHVIRVQALNGYIPLGALSGAAHGPQLSYLWSLDFISAVNSPTFSTWRKITFALSASGLLFMTSVVGPSSAVLMIPRPGMSHVKRTVTSYLNASEAALFPTHLDKTSGLNFSRYYEFEEREIIESSLTPDHHVIFSYTWGDTWGDTAARSFAGKPRVGQSVDRTLVDNPHHHVPTGDSYTIATTPTTLSLGQLTFHLPVYNFDDPELLVTNKSWVTRTLQPVVLAVCTQEFQRTEDSYYFQDDGSKGSLPNSTKLQDQLLEVYEHANDNTTIKPFMPPLWIPSPGNSHSLLGLFIRPGGTGRVGDSRFTACTVSSFWREAETSFAHINFGYRIKAELPTNREAMASSKLRPITIVPEDIRSLDYPCMAKGKMLSGEGVNAEVLATCFAAAISWIPALDNRDPDDPTIDHDMIEGYDQSQLSDSTPFSVMKIDTTYNGFGYGSTDTSIKLSLAVIISYCLIVVCYVAYTVATGRTSVAWDSAMELVMLALQSQAPDHLGPISVGINSMDTFRQSVGIRVRVDSEKNAEKLELVFAQDAGADDRRLGMVEPNKAY